MQTNSLVCTFVGSALGNQPLLEYFRSGLAYCEHVVGSPIEELFEFAYDWLKPIETSVKFFRVTSSRESKRVSQCAGHLNTTVIAKRVLVVFLIQSLLGGILNEVLQ